MKKTITKCNECAAEITGADPLLTFNGEEIDLCSDQCRLKWWMTIVNDAEAAGREIHVTSKQEEQTAKQPDSIPERNLKMVPRKIRKL